MACLPRASPLAMVIFCPEQRRDTSIYRSEKNTIFTSNLEEDQMTQFSFVLAELSEEQSQRLWESQSQAELFISTRGESMDIDVASEIRVPVSVPKVTELDNLWEGKEADDATFKRRYVLCKQLGGGGGGEVFLVLFTVFRSC